MAIATSVPSPTFGPTGFMSPSESAILAGRQADLSAAFGVNLDFGTLTAPTPQGQIAESDTACIANANDTFVALANSVDPAFATGRMQDAIARIYFLTRLPGQATVVPCTCIGLAGTIIPALALAQDTAGNIYQAVSGGTIPSSGTITLQFANQNIGPIPCPQNSLNIIYRTIPGWDSINNPADGELGTNVETAAAFETRREQSVALNSVGFLDSVLGSVLSVSGVLDAFAIDNPNAYPVAYTPTCVITGSIAGTALTVTSVVSGAIAIGMTITGSSSTNIGVAAGTTIVSGSGTSWVVSVSQTVAATTMNLGGVILGPNALYVAVVGGAQSDVARSIWNKKSPGCPYYAGNTSVTIYSTSVQVAPPGQPYTVVYETPSALPFVVAVRIANSALVPSNATTQIQNAVIAAFAGTDGGTRARIGSTVYASRFYAGITALGPWAEIISLLLGTPNTPVATITGTMGAAFTGSGSGVNLTISSVTGYVSAGDTISGPGVPAGTTIVSQSSGTTGAAGVYVTSQATTASSASLQTASSVLVASSVTGALAIGQFVFDATGNVIEGTTILSQLSGTAGAAGRYNTSMQQFVASEGMSLVAATLTSVSIPINQVPTISAACIPVTLV